MKKKGFTLIELLAVIVILALVALITIPLVLGVIDRVQIASYKESLRSVFGAADLYIASSEFSVFPEEGINVVDTKIQMKNKNFTSGKILKNEQGVLELDKVSNGKYCAGGTYDNIVIVTGSCDALDITPPTITIASNLVTSSSITIVANAEDLESGINGYQFSKDNGNTWTTKQISNVYNFTGLTNDTNYTFKVRVYNNNGLSTISEELNVATVDIPMPTYSINPVGWTSSAVVTITYPEREDGYIYEYSLDNALTWETVEEPANTKEITFNENGNVIARILDGTNEVSGMSYSVTTIDDINPTVTFSMDGNSTYAKIRATLVTVSDLESGVNPSSLKYLWTTSTTTPSEASFTSTFTNGNAIITPEGVTGGYYLWILASDNTDNKIITRSNVFNLDNTAPVITITGPSSITITEGATYVDQGATASDNINGNITSNIEVTSTVNRDVPGTYTVTYNVNDSAGNAATPRVRTVIVQSLYVAYTSIEQTVITSVQNYVTTHSSKLPLNVRNTTEITLTELRSNGYIGVIKDPVNPSIDCNGYILITKLGNNDYDYTPHMKCGNQNTISNTTQDGLIAHYKFDDFQEPTENILPENARLISDINSWSCYDGIAPPHHTWGVRTDRVVYQNGYMGIANSMKVFNLDNFSGTLGAVRWNLLSDYPENTDFTWSVMVRGIGSGIGKNLAIHRYSSNSTLGAQSSTTNHTLTNQWQKVTHSWKSRLGDLSHVYLLANSNEFEFEFALPQVEKKSHSTPFVNGNRDATVKDYSINNNEAGLTMDTTPKWINNSSIGGGAYQFSGSIATNAPRIETNLTYEKLTKYTLSAWAYRTSTNSFQFIVGGVIGNNISMGIRAFDNERFGLHTYDTVDKTLALSSQGAFPLNKWTHLVITVEYTHVEGSVVSGNAILYANGVQVGSNSFANVTTYNRGMLIGSPYYNGLNRAFQGTIDDVRVYNRILTASEINVMYKKQLNH